MKCPRCQHDNPPTAKFCVECATPLARKCARCGSVLPPAAKFCPECSRPAGAAPGPAASPKAYTPPHLAERILDSRAALEGERKQVTVLFADLKGSMELLADRDPEEARKLLDPVLERMMEAVHHYEGTVNQVMGDGIMALFGAPLAHEDHAVRGCYAALRMQEAIRRYTDEVRRAHGVEVQIRVGLNSGEVVVRSIGSDLRMDYTAVGQTTHLAARMEQLATPGTIRLTANTLALAEGYVAVKSIGPIPVKGLAEPVEVYELTGAGAARTRLQAARARGLTRFVGRDTELDQLRRAAGETRRGRGRIVAVVGEPGVGKSRLYYEFIHSHHVQNWLILEAGSVSYGKATPYLPLADFLRSYFKIDARDDIRGIRIKVTGGLLTLDEALKDTVPVALWLLDALPEDSPFLALEPADRRRQTLAAVKRILLRENQVHPLMLVFEDLHWIDSETQAFLDSLVESLPASRILLAVNYRPEYRHGWANKTYYCQLHIDPLPPESAEDLLDALVGRDPSTGSLKRLLIERTEGSPLFLEESVRTLVETRALVGERGAYRLVQATDALQVPATVQAIIAARIDLEVAAQEIGKRQVRRRLAVGHRTRLENQPVLDVMRVHELVIEPRFSDAWFAHDRDNPAASPARFFRGAAELIEFRVAPHEAGEAAHPRRLEPGPCCSGSRELIHFHGLCEPLHRDRADGLHGDVALGKRERVGGEPYGPRGGELLHPRREVGRLADRGVIHPEVAADRAHDDLAGIEPDANLDFDAMGTADLLRVAPDCLLHAEGGVAPANSVVPVGERRAEQRHDPVAHHLVHGSFVMVDGLHHPLEHRVEELACFLGVAVGEQFHRALQIGEEHGDLFALALERGPRVEDPLGEVPRRVCFRRRRRPRRYAGGMGAFGAELCHRGKNTSAPRAFACKRCRALHAELRGWRVIVLAARALHGVPPTRGSDRCMTSGLPKKPPRAGQRPRITHLRIADRARLLPTIAALMLPLATRLEASALTAACCSVRLPWRSWGPRRFNLALVYAGALAV